MDALYFVKGQRLPGVGKTRRARDAGLNVLREILDVDEVGTRSDGGAGEGADKFDSGQSRIFRLLIELGLRYDGSAEAVLTLFSANAYMTERECSRFCPR